MIKVSPQENNEMLKTISLVGAGYRAHLFSFWECFYLVLASYIYAANNMPKMLPIKAVMQAACQHIRCQEKDLVLASSSASFFRIKYFFFWIL